MENIAKGFLCWGLFLFLAGCGHDDQSGNSDFGSPAPIGSCYGGGVVFHSNSLPFAPAGQRGLIAALSDVAGTFQWDTNGTFNSAGTSRALFTGGINTSNILMTDGPAAPAALAANTYTGGGHNDWFLPSEDELALLQIQFGATTNLFTNCGGTSPSTANSYWSSSVYIDNSTAYFVNFGNGVVYVDSMGQQYLVRAIRAF